jgi:regulator of cell morphogenesis and NO signaling
MTFVIPEPGAREHSVIVSGAVRDLPLDELVDHIVDRHHRYAQGAIPAIRESLQCAVERWGSRHAPLLAVQAIFNELAIELEPHMAKEEHLLFPAIRDLVRARRQHTAPPPAAFATLLHPIRVMEDDHARAMELLDALRRETRGYEPPAAADEPGRDCYRQLSRFDEDLQTHISLEDDTLFPRALELELPLG